MPTSFSTNLALALPVTGELSGTWGTTVNDNITNMLDQALGYQAFTATGGPDTLTIPDGTTGVARSIYIQLNGTGGGTVNVPTAKTKMYFVFNNTASAITFKVTSQTGVSIPAAAKIALVSNGTDIITAENYLAALTLGAALPAASGGTGLTAAGTVGNVLTSTGSAWASSAPAAGASGANPTGTIAGAVVNGSASTFMRSDAAPALSLTIAQLNTAVTDADVAISTAAQTFTGGQRGAVTALTSSSASVAINLATNCNFSYTTVENSTLAAPSNPVAGQSGIIIITQGATARTLAYNTFYKFAGGTVPTLTATASAVDTFAYYVESATRATCQLIKDVK